MDEVGNLYRELCTAVKMHLDSRNAKYLAAQQDNFEHAIVSLSNDLSEFKGSMYDFRALLDPSSQRAERLATRVAWLSQTAFDGRAVSVNEKPLRLTRRENCFPLLEQARELGYQPTTPNVLRYKQLVSQANSKLHVMLHNRRRNELTVVQAVKFSTAGSLNRRGFTRTQDAPLFGGQRVYGNVYAPPRDVYSLLLARDMLRQSIPNINVRAMVVLIDDERFDELSQSYISSPNFQSHDLTNAKYPRGGSVKVALDGYPVGPSSTDFDLELTADPLHFYRLPNCEWQWLQYSPSSRSTRCLMMLDSAVTTQMNSTELRHFSYQELRNRVTGEFGLYYPIDLHRHDVEGGLLPHDLFVKDMVRGHPRLSVGPAGIALIMNIRRKINVSSNITTNSIMEAVVKHEDFFTYA